MGIVFIQIFAYEQVYFYIRRKYSWTGRLIISVLRIQFVPILLLWKAIVNCIQVNRWFGRWWFCQTKHRQRLQQWRLCKAILLKLFNLEAVD